MTTKNFHHGNLRDALITAGIEAVTKEGIEKLSLRSLAKNIGVAPSAPFKHFSNKDELIFSLSETAAKEIVEKYVAAQHLSLSDESKLQAVCMAYLNFAEEKANVFKLLFVSEQPFSHYQKAIDTLRDEAFTIFKTLVGQLIINTNEDTKLQLSVSCWALLHGFAILHMSGKLEGMKYNKEQAIDAVISLAQSKNT